MRCDALCRLESAMHQQMTMAKRLVADGGAEELGGVVEAVHVPGVSDVLLPVLDWALAGLQSLHHTSLCQTWLPT
jgi:hypothetical protein